jgi:serine/threonine-protein kinase
MTPPEEQADGPAPKAPVPERIGPYKVHDLLGTGGMGRVYRGLDEALQREVALKVLLPALAADAEFVARFTREARAAALLNHPNITQIYATGLEGAAPWFAMELIRGSSLETLARERGAIEPYEAAAYIAQAAAGLRHAAQKGLIHRDVKPSNLMLTEDGVVKVTDFGLAKAAQADSHLTATGEVLGSPGYISPEQAQGQPTDHRSDIYSLGATFYHLVTGRLPFQAPTAVAMILKHMNEPLRSPRAVNAGIPFPVASVIQRMMAKRAGERYQDYDALLRDLERAVGETQRLRGPEAGSVTVRRAPVAMNAAETRAPAAGPAVAERGGRVKPVSPLTGTTPSSGLPLLPIGLMLAVLGLVAAGAWRSWSERPDAAPAPGGGAAPALEGEGTFTTHSAAAKDERSAALVPGARHASLVFLSNDHDQTPNGGLLVKGRVQNSGTAEARLAHVRVRVLLDNGTLAAQGETPLVPPLLEPGQVAEFTLTIDYNGPAGTIRAELIWSE